MTTNPVHPTDHPVAPILSAMFDSTTDSQDLVRSAFIHAQIRDDHRYVRRVRFDHGIDLGGIDWLGPEPIRRAAGPSSEVALYRTPGAWIIATINTTWAEVEVSAPVEAHAIELAERLRAQVARQAPAGTVTAFSWYLTARAMAWEEQVELELPTWDEIDRNYPKAIRSHLAEIMALRRPRDLGRLILWHGAPGTGKTTAIRALIREWADWCSPHLIADADRLFQHPHYLNQVAAHDSPGDDPDRCKLVVAEDADQYLRGSTAGTDGSLGRLLNLTDGVLGRGSRLLVLLTTNEPIDRLHPALTRPGRCLAQLEFPAFPVHEAGEWDPRLSGMTEPPTLAEMFAASGANRPLGAQADGPGPSIGLYL